MELKQKPKILLYDLEITPTLGWTYGLWDTHVIKVEREPYIMCFAYKWYGESATKCVAQTDFKGYKKNPYDDLAVVKELWRLLDEADIVIAHNAARFDNKVSNERFLVHRLGPPSPYKTIDTLQVVKRYFKNGSNALNNLCEKLNLGCKSQQTHGSLWRNCVDGCEVSWKKMIQYCKQDVNLLESLYKEVRPYITNHPNLALIGGKEDGCPKCGSRKIQYRGYSYTSVCIYHRVQCMKCGGWSRERVIERDDFDGKPVFDKPDYVNISG